MAVSGGFGLDFVINNLDNINVQNMVKNSPDVQKAIQDYSAKAFEARRVAHPEGDPTAGTLVPVDTGFIGDADDGSCGILGLGLAHAEPRAAAGLAVFGLGLVALPLVAKAHSLDEGLEVERVGIQEACGFSYQKCKRTRQDADWDKPLTLQELETRLGPLDPSGLATEILRTEAAASEKARCTDEEIGCLQKSVLRSRAAVRQLRRRSALAFMGLNTSASADEVNQKYKRMALEMHPDKGGDAERFQQLQDMKERLTKSIQEEEDEEAKSKAEADQEKDKLPPTAKAKQLRREAHAEAIKLWDSAREAEAEMFTEKGMLKGNPQPVLAKLRAFVDQFSARRCRMLPHGKKEPAREALWEFQVEGLELIALAALVDPSATASMIATNINYKVVSRSGSKEVAQEAKKLLEAVADVQTRVENFLHEMGKARAEAQEAEVQAQEEEAAAGGPLQTGDIVILVGEDFGEETGKRAVVLGMNQGGIAVRLASGRRLTVPRAQLERAPAEEHAKSEKEEMDFKSGAAFSASGTSSVPANESSPIKNNQDTKAQNVSNSDGQEVMRQGPVLLCKSAELPPDPERDDWDEEFTHPYVGALHGAGDGIFCRACCRWITTRKYAHEPFLRHARAAHRTPPPGWKGAIPKDAD